MKFVILLVAVLVLVWLVSGSLRRLQQRGGRGRPSRAAPPQVEGMVACAHCGVHLPASLAVGGEAAPSERYCSVPHRDAGPRAR